MGYGVFEICLTGLGKGFDGLKYESLYILQGLR